jgi:DNA polymerase III alpha subunit
MTAYADLQVTTHFPFLRGASSPAELFKQAKLLGTSALGITDRNSLAGIVIRLTWLSGWSTRWEQEHVDQRPTF